MSSLESSLPLPSVEAADPSAGAGTQSRAARWGSLLEQAGEWFNPILVKECRQALKSKQFGITLTLLLILGWLWSIVGIAWIGPEAYYSFRGAEMFFGYFLVLAFPLLVIVPYSAFRSLAGECEDRTFELVSITTLHPRQIVAGKLGSAIVQMLVYFSALSPCLAFTYLLRGIDVASIVFFLAYVFVESLALSSVALLLATVAREKHWQIVMSIALIVGLLTAFFTNWGLGGELLSANALVVRDPWFWIGHGAGLTAVVSYLVQLFLATAAQITFASENRSTSLRVVMLAQFLLFTGWMAGIAALVAGEGRMTGFGEPLVAYVIVAGLHWYAMGLLMVLEQPNLSPRVKRSLPQSFLGRMFLTWFNPGPGTGYLFVVSNLAAVVVIALGATAWLNANGFSPSWNVATGISFTERITTFTVLAVSYVVFYLGLGKLVIRWVRRWLSAGFIGGVAVQGLLLAMGTGIPLIIYGMGPMRGDGYSLLQVTNPFWTLAEAMDRRSVSFDLELALYILPTLAAVVFLFNVPSAVAEVRHVRIAAPARVLEDTPAAP